MALRTPYYVQTGSMWDNPYGAPPEEIQRMCEELPQEMVAQVVYGKFVEMSGVVFTSETVTNLFDQSQPKVMGDVYVDEAVALQTRVAWKVAKENGRRWNHRRFAHGIDLARKKDFTVITVLDTSTKPARLVYWRRINRVPWTTIYAEIGRAQWVFPGSQLIDGTGSGGDVVAEALGGLAYCSRHHSTFGAAESCRACLSDPRAGASIRLNPRVHIMTSATKVQLINHLQQCLAQGFDPNQPDKAFGAIRCPPIHHLIEELTEYQWDDKKLQTDCVMSLALAALEGIHGQVDPALIGSAFGS